MPNPTPRIAPFHVVSDVEDEINRTTHESVETRARVGLDINRRLKQFANTPAVVALRLRVYAELLGMEVDQARVLPDLVVDTPEPEAPAGVPVSTGPAVLSTEPQSVIMLYGNENDDSEVTEAFIYEGDGASQAGETLASLRGCDYNVLPLNPVPELLVANQRLAKARDVLRGWPRNTDDVGVNSLLEAIERTINGR